MKYGALPENEIFARSDSTADVSAAVAEIIENVRRKGDAALLDYTRRFDGADIDSPELDKEEIEAAYGRIPAALKESLLYAAESITRYHSKQKMRSFSTEGTAGRLTGQRVVPLERVGVYVPGGTAAYPSTVLMDVIPACIAGVGEIIMVSPPDRNGKICDAVLAAAKIAGVTRIFRAGGAQAIAALAYGTESIPAVDKIVGPGNAYVAEAKRQVFGRVSIDMIAGPSEILVISDGKTDPEYLAADMLSQAEHDRRASAVLLTDSDALAKAVAEAIERQLPRLERAEIARASIESEGKIIIVEDLDRACDVANSIAPEHIELCVDEPMELFAKIRNAGSAFLGRYCPEAVGDYLAGPNHTLPTGGTARFSSALSVYDFCKRIQYVYYTEESLRNVSSAICELANTEGLTGHAASVTVRTGDVRGGEDLLSPNGARMPREWRLNK